MQDVVQDLTIAIPKGKLGEEALSLLSKIGLPTDTIQENSRKLTYHFPEARLKYLICRPTDIPTYVEYGAADLGIVGKDSLVEASADVFELVDLKFGFCKFVVAMPQKILNKVNQKDGNFSLKQFADSRVATKFPKIAANFFKSKGIQVEVIKLHGNIELAPSVGLAEMIVDIVSTGRTLKENDLIPVEEMFSATARLIANRVSYRMKNKRIQDISSRCYEHVNEKE